jgi:3-oxoacyl-[acyl-carrier-protein] synthase-3
MTAPHTTKLNVESGPAGARILGLGAHLPARVVGNDEIAPRIDSSDNWITVRSGIARRRFAAPDENVADMAVEAAAKAVANSGADPADVDLVVVATCTHVLQLPGVAAEVAHRIGASGAGAVDVNAACAGFCYALSSVSDSIRAGNSRLAVVVGAERYTNILDLTDRGTAFLFGDGAGAMVIGPSDEPGIGPTVWGSDGSQRDLITQRPNEDSARSDAGLAVIRMEGPAVYRWAVTELAAVAREACEQAGIKPEELGAFVPHQANLRIIDALTRSLKLPDSVVVARDIVEVGNTSAASIPIALTHLVEAGEVPSGAPALLLGFGAGLTYAAQVVLTP